MLKHLPLYVCSVGVMLLPLVAMAEPQPKQQLPTAQTSADKNAINVTDNDASIAIDNVAATIDHKGTYCMIDSTDSEETIVRKAAHVVPSQRQYNWQRQELTAFLHFGVNTFTGREWGDGTEDPAVFNPAHLDADQWITALQEGGFKCAILTCKHHDGFCLWPSAETEHSVKHSPWKDGKGDVVREVADACHRHGMGFGVYLSPWDRNCPLYGTDEYNDYFVRQLTELLTNYGQVDEVWFDGACGEGPNGKKQEYDFVRWYKLIRQLQPQAVISIMGPDCRWVGTESGKGREQEWSVVTNTNLDQQAISQNSQHDVLLQPMGDRRQQDLGSRALIKTAKGLVWYPAETDVSILKGWFWSPENDTTVKSADQLMDIYYTSVGCNGVLLLNVPPNTDGLLSDVDVAALKAFGQRRDALYAHNLLCDAKLLDANGNDASVLADGNYDTSCTTACPAIGKPVTVSTSYEIIWPEAKTFSTLMLQEDIREGQHVEAFALQIMDDNGNWREVTRGTTIGYKRLLRLPATTTRRARLVIEASRLNPVIAEMGLY